MKWKKNGLLKMFKNRYEKKMMNDFSRWMREADKGDVMGSIFQNGNWITFFEQTPELCIKAIREGLEDKDLIKIEWTDEMEREWTLKNI